MELFLKFYAKLDVDRKSINLKSMIDLFALVCYLNHGSTLHLIWFLKFLRENSEIETLMDAGGHNKYLLAIEPRPKTIQFKNTFILMGLYNYSNKTPI